MLLRIDEAMIILNCSRDTIYRLLRQKMLIAHAPDGKPTKNRTKILASSVEKYLQAGEIPAKAFKGRD
jgi:excisionase family DNA binding protein